MRIRELTPQYEQTLHVGSFAWLLDGVYKIRSWRNREDIANAQRRLGLQFGDTFTIDKIPLHEAMRIKLSLGIKRSQEGYEYTVEELDRKGKVRFPTAHLITDENGGIIEASRRTESNEYSELSNREIVKVATIVANLLGQNDRYDI